MSLGTRLFWWWTPAQEPPPPPPPPPPQVEPDELFYASEAYGDDAIGELVMGDGPCGGTRVDPLPAADHWVFLNGVRSIGVKMASISASRDLGQRGTLRLTMLKTPDVAFTLPQVGWLVQLSWHDHLQWAGIVENIRMVNRAGTEETVLEVQLDCASWERIAERKLTHTTYQFLTTRAVFETVLGNFLRQEGITTGVLDTGLELSWVGPRQAGDYIRVSELLRDVAESSGGVYDIDPFKRLNFRKESLGDGAMVMGNLVALHQVESDTERQDYRNVQIIKVKGKSGDTEHIFIRENTVEIAARRAIEGGTGRYEHYEQIDHPLTDDDVELGRLAVAAASVKLQTYGQHVRSLKTSLNFPRYRLGDVVLAHHPEHQVAGTWQLAGVRYRAVHDRLFADYHMVQTSALQRAFQGWLKITGAGKALVQIPGTPVFTQLATVTASGTWTVPDSNGDGTDVEVEFNIKGSGGGGTAAWGSAAFQGYPDRFYPECELQAGSFAYPAPGIAGDPGGGAVTFRRLPVGTVVSITIGPGGAGSTFICGFQINPAAQGATTTVSIGGTVVAQASGGGGGYSGVGPGRGLVGDFLHVGTGAHGGLGGAIDGISWTNPGLTGAGGYVEIRY